MISESHIRYGSRVSLQGSSLLWIWYQLKMRSEKFMVADRASKLTVFKHLKMILQENRFNNIYIFATLKPTDNLK
jgi:hypothetical protein